MLPVHQLKNSRNLLTMPYEILYQLTRIIFFSDVLAISISKPARFENLNHKMQSVTLGRQLLFEVHCIIQTLQVQSPCRRGNTDQKSKNEAIKKLTIPSNPSWMSRKQWSLWEAIYTATVWRKKCQYEEYFETTGIPQSSTNLAVC